MPPDQPTPNSNLPPPIRFQFSLKSLLLITMVAAVCYSALFSGYLPLSALTCLAIVIAVVIALTIGYVWGDENLETFCFGALCPAILGLSVMPMLVIASAPISGPQEAGGFRWYLLAGLLAYFAVVAACGLLAVGGRRVLRPTGPNTNERSVEPHSDDSQSPFA